MDQATATAPTPTTMQTDARAAYDRATALAARLVDRSRILPRSVDVATFGGPYSVRLHFGPGLEAGRAVLDIASTADGDAVRDEASSCAGDWIECHTVIDGVPVVARALLTKTHADQLLSQTPPSPAAPAAQPVSLGASPVAQP